MSYRKCCLTLFSFFLAKLYKYYYLSPKLLILTSVNFVFASIILLYHNYKYTFSRQSAILLLQLYILVEKIVN